MLHKIDGLGLASWATLCGQSCQKMMKSTTIAIKYYNTTKNIQIQIRDLRVTFVTQKISRYQYLKIFVSYQLIFGILTPNLNDC